MLIALTGDMCIVCFAIILMCVRTKHTVWFVVVSTVLVVSITLAILGKGVTLAFLHGNIYLTAILAITIGIPYAVYRIINR